MKSEIDMKAFDVGGWCNYCSVLLTGGEGGSAAPPSACPASHHPFPAADIPFDTIKSEVAALKVGKVERWQAVWDAFSAEEVKAGRGAPQWS